MNSDSFYSSSESFEMSPPNFEDMYWRINILGHGSFGVVSLVIDRYNRYFAMKKIKFEDHEEGPSTAVLREISLLREFNHRNIVKLIGLDYSWKSKFYSSFAQKQGI